MPELRHAAAADEEWAMHDLVRRVFDAPYGRAYDVEDASFRDPDNHFLGFWDGDVLTGVVRVDLEEDGKAVLRKVAVDPGCQRKGIGREMVQAAEAFIRARGYRLCALGAWGEAVLFWQKVGYEIGPWHRGPKDAVTQPTVDMRKALHTKPPMK